LIVGSNCRSAIATLVERQTRYVMLVHLPDDHSATAVRDGLLATIKTLPDHLRKSLTWDQGTELTRHAEITLATKMDIYVCDPHSPWQRGSNENTNGLLRQYFPKGTDLNVHSPARLLEVATELNARPRKTLGGITPAKAMQRLLFDPERPIVATTA
jgi:IS30 family transposase